MLPHRAAFDRFRYFILGLGLLCLAAIACNHSIINFAFICMTGDKDDVIETSNGTLRQRYDYTPTEKSAIIWAVAIGTIVGTFPINWAYIRWGARIPFFVSGLISAAATALSPAAAHHSLWTFVAIRFLQGLAYSADFAAIGIIVVRWSPISQTAIFISFLTCFSSIAHSVTNPLAGAFCTSSFGWRGAFYFHAILTAVLFVIWVIIYHDDPQYHRSVSHKELAVIQENKTKEHIERDSFVPYWEICTNKAILVVWFNALTELVGYLIMLTYAPIYINKVLGYSITETSYLASFGALLHTPIKIICGILSDKITCIPEKPKMCFFNTIAVGLAGILCGAIGFMPSPLFAVLCLAAAGAISGANTAGFYKCASLHSRQYAHFVLATVQFSKCAALVIGPAMVAIFLKSDADANGWIVIFLINAVVQLVANTLFYFTASAVPAEFTKITRHNRAGVKDSEKGVEMEKVE